MNKRDSFLIDEVVTMSVSTDRVCSISYFDRILLTPKIMWDMYRLIIT